MTCNAIPCEYGKLHPLNDESMMFWQDAHSAFALHALFWPAVQLRRHLLCSGSDARSRPTGGVIDKLSQQQQVMPVACKRVLMSCRIAHRILGRHCWSTRVVTAIPVERNRTAKEPHIKAFHQRVLTHLRELSVAGNPEA